MTKWICIIVFFVFVNNAYWILRSGKASTVQSVEAACVESHSSTDVTSTLKSTDTKMNVSQATVSASQNQQQAPLESRHNNEPPIAIQANIELSEESRDWIDDLNYDKEIFDLDSEENKLAVIEKLTPQGADLAFIQQVMASEESEHVKLAALYKLRYQNQYGAIHTAVEALNSGSKPLTLAALDILKSTNDISLIPQLKQLTETQDQDDIKRAINNTIQALEKSVSMGMDPN